jgi:hypothetical protein
MTASNHNGIAPPRTMAMRRRRIPAGCAVITALLSAAASSAVGAAQLPVTTWLRSEWAHPGANEPVHQVTAGLLSGTHSANVLSKPPSGEITPDPPEIPPQSAQPLSPPVAAPPPRAQQPLSPSRQQERPPPQQEGPSPGQQGPSPGQEGPSPGPPPPPQPPRGHVQLSP